MSVPKTNAARLLDAQGIAYELRAYEVGSDHVDAEEAAQRLGMDPDTVFKTLVARGDRHGVCVAVIPAASELDLKALAKLTGDRKVDTVSLKEVQPLTGYVRGGVTALGLKRDFPVYVDAQVERISVIGVSAGQRGVQLVLSPADYLRAVKAKVGPISRPKPR